MAAHPANPGSTVTLESVSKAYGTTTVLHDFSLELAAGELVCLLGPSGCGKTTALRCIAGLEPVSAGRILLGGTDVTAVPVSRRDIGMVFQQYSLFPHLTVAGNVEFGLRMRRVDRATRAARAAEMLEVVGLERHAGRYPHELSGGQQQRVALARALVTRPRALLLDEPLSALDAKVRVRLREQIRAIQTELGISTVFVTHDQEEALAISDRVAVMDNGRIAQLGTPEELYRRPASAFIADFVGLSNRLPGVIDSHPHGTVVRVQGAAIPALVPGIGGAGTGTGTGAHPGGSAGAGTATGTGTGTGTDSSSGAGSDSSSGPGVSDGAATALTPGTPVTAFVRPEHVRLAAGAEAARGSTDEVPTAAAPHNGAALTAQVVSSGFLGPIRRTVVQLADGTVLASQHGADTAYAPGESVTVAFAAEPVAVTAR